VLSATLNGQREAKNDRGVVSEVERGVHHVNEGRVLGEN